MAIVYINTTATTVGAVIQPAPLSVTANLVTLDDLDLTGLPDGTIFIAFEADGAQLSNWLQATKLSLDGTGVLISGVATVESTGNQVIDPIEGSGDLQSQDAIADGSGDTNTTPSLKAGTGDLLSQEATFSGDGDTVIYQTGARVDFKTQDAQLTGVGSLNKTIVELSSDLFSGPASLSGGSSVQPVQTASGDLQAQSAEADGTGNLTSIITGSGDLASLDAALTGSGFKIDTKTGTGALQAVGAEIFGLANIVVTITGNGVLATQPATLIGSGFRQAVSTTISIPVAAVGPYDGTPETTYQLTVPFNIETIEFIWSSDDTEYQNGNLSVELRLIDAQGELVLASMNAVSGPNFILYDALGADSLNRFQRVVAALAAGPATIRISGYDDLTTFVNPFSQDGGLMIHNVDLAA